MNTEKTLQQLLKQDPIGAMVEYSRRVGNGGFTVSKEVHKKLGEFNENWPRLLKESEHISKLEQFPPASGELPSLVFVSASWCFPCDVIKPTFYGLTRHFSKAPVFYADADELDAWKHGIESVPQLVAFFPEGKRVVSGCGSSTPELWKNMNALLTIGAAYKGEFGELVCTDTKCSVQDWESEK